MIREDNHNVWLTLVLRFFIPGWTTIACLGSWILVSVTLTLAGLCAQAPTITHSSTPVMGSAHIVVGDCARMDAILDLNLDGKMDAVGFWTSAKDRTRGDLCTMMNDGNGKMTEEIILSGVRIASNNPKSLRVRLGSGIANATILYQAYLLEKTSPTGIISTNGVRVRYGN